MNEQLNEQAKEAVKEMRKSPLDAFAIQLALHTAHPGISWRVTLMYVCPN